MRVASEIYKGIEFVRISSLPVEQKEKLWESFDRRNIIKILKDKSLLKDCVQYQHYKNWYEQTYTSKVEVISAESLLKTELKAASVSIA
jgi:hypothetical protein